MMSFRQMGWSCRGFIEANLPIIFLIFISFVIYSNTLAGEFIYDDNLQVTSNPWIRDPRFIQDIFLKNVWAFQETSSNYYRPLMHLSYMLAYQVSSLNPWGYHLLNLIGHCGVTLLVYLLACRLLPSGNSRINETAIIVALLFATHPIHSEAVSWIAALPEVMYSFFYLLALLLYLRATDVNTELHLPPYIFSLVCFVFATLYKEPALTLPALIFIYDYLYGGRQALRSLKRTGPYFLIGLAYFFLRCGIVAESLHAESYSRLSILDLVANVLSLFTLYLQKLLLPIDLHYYYVFSPLDSTGMTSIPVVELWGPTTLAALIVVILLLVALLISFVKKKEMFLSLVIMILPLLPALYLPAISGSPFAERYLYLPSFGFLLLLGLLYRRLSQAQPIMRMSLIVTCLFLATYYSTITIERTRVWQNDYTLWADSAKHAPHSAMVLNNLGMAANERGQLDEAIRHFYAAINVDSSYAGAYTNLGRSYGQLGQFEDAIASLRHAIQLQPDFLDARLNLGTAYGMTGQLDKSIEQFAVGLEIAPDNVATHNQIALAYERKGMLDKALFHRNLARKLSASRQL